MATGASSMRNHWVAELAGANHIDDMMQPDGDNDTTADRSNKINSGLSLSLLRRVRDSKGTDRICLQLTHPDNCCGDQDHYQSTGANHVRKTWSD